MFNFQGSELIIILLLALVILGPEKLPEAMRRMGRLYADLRKMSTSFQEEFRAAVDEPMREIRDTANTLRDSTDFRKLASGERDEKPKSAEMQDVTEPSETEPSETDASEPEPTREASPTPIPAPPAPFSSSQTISARAPERAPDPDPGDESPDPVPQIAVDDELGLREARPAAASGDEDRQDVGA